MVNVSVVAILLALLSIFIIICSGNEVTECFRDYRIGELLKIKRSIDKVSCDGFCERHEDVTPVQKDAKEDLPAPRIESDPYSLPLVQERSGSWEPEKPSKLQTIFQISVTALSFLSFGGYLLCLIVQAIKSKGTTYYHPVATATTATGAGNLKKIKIYRRHRRDANSSEISDDQMAGPDPMEMYNVLRMFAEGYVKLASD